MTNHAAPALEGVDLVDGLRPALADMSDEQARAFWQRIAALGDESEPGRDEQ